MKSTRHTVLQEVEFGIVYNPILNQLWTARRGLGAFYNGTQVLYSSLLMFYLKNYSVSFPDMFVIFRSECLAARTYQNPS
jgi:fructose-1,6-bisphosphatase/inositol monophosphatase family enzyme